MVRHNHRFLKLALSSCLLLMEVAPPAVLASQDYSLRQVGLNNTQTNQGLLTLSSLMHTLRLAKRVPEEPGGPFGSEAWNRPRDENPSSIVLDRETLFSEDGLWLQVRYLENLASWAERNGLLSRPAGQVWQAEEMDWFEKALAAAPVVLELAEPISVETLRQAQEAFGLPYLLDPRLFVQAGEVESVEETALPYPAFGTEPWHVGPEPQVGAPAESDAVETDQKTGESRSWWDGTKLRLAIAAYLVDLFLDQVLPWRKNPESVWNRDYPLGINLWALGPLFNQDALSIYRRESALLGNPGIDETLRVIFGKLSYEAVRLDEAVAFFRFGKIVPYTMVYTPEAPSGGLDYSIRLKKRPGNTAAGTPASPVIMESITEAMAERMREELKIEELKREYAAKRRTLWVVPKYFGGMLPAVLLGQEFDLPVIPFTKYPLPNGMKALMTEEKHNPQGSLERYYRVVGIRPGDGVLLVDDERTTGQTHVDAAELLNESGISVEGVIVFLEATEAGAERMRHAGVKSIALHQTTHDMREEKQVERPEQIPWDPLPVVQSEITADTPTRELPLTTFIANQFWKSGNRERLLLDHALMGRSVPLYPEDYRHVTASLANQIRESVENWDERVRQILQSGGSVYVLGMAPDGIIASLGVAMQLRLPVTVMMDRSAPRNFPVIHFTAADTRDRSVAGLREGDAVIIVGGNLDNDETVVLSETLRQQDIDVLAIAGVTGRGPQLVDVQGAAIPVVYTQDYSSFGESVFSPAADADGLIPVLSDPAVLDFIRWIDENKTSTFINIEVDARSWIAERATQLSETALAALKGFDYVLRAEGVPFVVFRPDGRDPFAVRLFDPRKSDDLKSIMQVTLAPGDDRILQVVTIEELYRYWLQHMIRYHELEQPFADYTEIPFFESLMQGTTIRAHGLTLTVLDVLGAGNEAKVYDVADQNGVRYPLRVGRKDVARDAQKWREITKQMGEDLHDDSGRVHFIRYLSYDPHWNSVLMERIPGDPVPFEYAYLTSGSLDAEKLYEGVELLQLAAAHLGAVMEKHRFVFGGYTPKNLVVTEIDGQEHIYLIDPKYPFDPEMIELNDMFWLGKMLYWASTGSKFPISSYFNLERPEDFQLIGDRYPTEVPYKDYVPESLKQFIKRAVFASSPWFSGFTEMAQQLAHVLEDIQQRLAAEVADSQLPGRWQVKRQGSAVVAEIEDELAVLFEDVAVPEAESDELNEMVQAYQAAVISA